ncbi:MAG: hypothetical protein ACJ74W_20300 [Pyrinomonadaceae bacterium]
MAISRQRLYLIKLPMEKKPEDFREFMFAEVFPMETIARAEVDSEGRRIDGLYLHSHVDAGTQEFLLIVRGPIAEVDARRISHRLISLVDQGKIDQINAFGAKVEKMDDFSEYFSWTRQDEQT